MHPGRSFAQWRQGFEEHGKPAIESISHFLKPPTVRAKHRLITEHNPAGWHELTCA